MVRRSLAVAIASVLFGVGSVGVVDAAPGVFPGTKWEEAPSARDLARLGVFYQNRGPWNDRQRLSAAWVDAATRPQVSPSVPRGDPAASPSDDAGVYGFNWWANGLRRNGQRLWPGVPASAFSASGWNNNRLSVVPDWNLIVVRLGQDQTTGFAITNATWAEFLRRLGAALTAPDGRSPRVTWRPRAW